jgi:hypothetical protein
MCGIRYQPELESSQHFFLAHRAFAAALADALRSSSVMVFNRALPPFRPRATAAAFFRFTPLVYTKRLEMSRREVIYIIPFDFMALLAKPVGLDGWHE